MLRRSYDVDRDLQLARKLGLDNLFRCTYVLPDGVRHTKGFVKDPEAAHRYLNLTDESHLTSGGTIIGVEKPESAEDRKSIDLTINEFDLTNERFLVPEMISRPAYLYIEVQFCEPSFSGMNQAGLAECIVRAINSCHPHLHHVLYESILLTGGSTLFPRFAERLERELRPLVPDNYQVKITTQQDPILGVWRGGSLLASSPDFKATCVTKAEHEELGSARCGQRFLR
ncbi:actin-related protein 6-like [Rhodamnia argentea]|uniref:Actin-related protein 6-like n=1 Tax=Rhodamnia argentea TaxID=178133 RepID=A0ABM3HBN5_9MYRT|nr:actin-related protein 6-like [Rhodamnia argentea]